jgi:hypothetical protein
VKRPTMLVQAVLHQAALDLDLSVERDVETLQRRCKHEGLSFLTITLPMLSDSLERGLENGRLSCPSNFARHGSLPRFLGGFFSRVFTRDGVLLPDVDPRVIGYIRQICRFFKKLKIGCTADRNRKAAAHFLEVERELREGTEDIRRQDNYLDKISGILWSQVFPEINYTDLICHHGPGQTAEKLMLNERQRIRHWPIRSELTFPSDLHCYPNLWMAAQFSGLGECSVSVPGVEYIELKDEPSVRVVFVPKTQTAPRVIAIEPSHMQYMQQSLKDYMYDVIESHRLTKRSIRFTRQDVNQTLARTSSIDRRLATLDLKDASDRVHLGLVQRIFKTSGLLEFLEDARSIHATLPDGTNLVLNKYASMGSALCFPVEACVFYTLIQSAMHALDGRRPTSSSILYYSSKIDIYGDDIIVPVEYTDVVVNYLESYLLKVNVNKSFRSSLFRESCGADYYNGYPVNPVYARQVPHDDSRQWEAKHVMAWMATADLFYLRGQWIVAQAIRDLLCRVVRRTIPKSRELGSGVSFFSYLFTTDLYWHRELQCWKQKRIHYDPIKRKDSIDGDELACLNKWGFSSISRGHPSYSRSSDSTGYRSVDRPDIGEAKRQYYGAVTTSGIEYHYWGTSASVRDSGICRVQNIYGWTGQEFSPLQPVLSSSYANGEGTVCSSTRNRERSLETLFENRGLVDAVDYLDGRSIGIDFGSSTKRGGFKSKRRWVSLAG